ncbi:MAG: putative sugar nucleotidyl transferase [Rhodothermaceae bacterium]
MKTSICIFEDDFYQNFYPLSFSRPTFDLLSGAFTLAEKISNYYSGTEITYLCRDIFEKNSFDNNAGYDSVLFLNGRIVADRNITKAIPLIGENEVFVQNGSLAGIRVNKELISKIDFNNPDFLASLGIEKVTEVEVTLAEYIWDLIELNGREITNDFAQMKNHIYTTDDYPENISLINRDNILIGNNCSISPFVCIDAKSGPVIIGNNVTIFPHSYIQGPAFIGDNSVIKAGSKIYHNSSIGSVCKVGGEIENSIIHSYSNKQHDGFLGHSYLGSWVNLGAGTTNSDLKNNYSDIKINLNNTEIETGLQFLGLLMGDHSKTAINTTINTGSAAGFSCNLFGDVFSQKNYPSFSWGGGNLLSTYDLEKSKDVARQVMARRNKTFGRVEENIFNQVFQLTKADRKFD